MAPTSAPRREKPARILIIDDQEQNTRLLARILAKAGYEQVASTTNSDDALALHAQFKPDLVLLDVYMRGKDGFAVLEGIVSLSGSDYVRVQIINDDDSADVTVRAH